MKFKEWLVTQVDRDDTVGDLAKDFIRAGNRLPTEVLSAHPDALQTLKDARLEWKEENV